MCSRTHPVRDRDREKKREEVRLLLSTLGILLTFLFPDVRLNIPEKAEEFSDMFGRKMKFSPGPTLGGGGGPYVGTGKKILGGWSGRFRME